MTLKHPILSIGFCGLAVVITVIGAIYIRARNDYVPPGTWFTASTTHQGYPLHLRYPALPDIPTTKASFPRLLVVTQTLQKVRESGLPEPDYNDSLMSLDESIVGLFAHGSGRIILIETFGGKRTYYFYVAENAPIERVMSEITKRFGDHVLKWEVKTDPEWTFISRYADDYQLQREG